MRIVVLASSLYSETACAMAARIAESGHVPVGALALSSLDSRTVQRKLGQWGIRDVLRYASSKLIPHSSTASPQLRNRYLQPFLKHGDGAFRSLREVAKFYGFPVATCNDQNAPGSIAHLQEWSPDLIIFTGGNILRSELLGVPRLGVLNVHLGLLPEIRGMSTLEWSLLTRVSVGVTIHYIDSGIDTGPILRRYEFPCATDCESLSDLRNRLIAFGVEKISDVVSSLDCGALSAAEQVHLDGDSQFFVMHEWLQARAAERLTKIRVNPVAAQTVVSR
jgi:folate-dependent phosphoribosylglycinamide formyltransferase PurN